MKRYLIILALCGAMQAEEFDYRDPLGKKRREAMEALREMGCDSTADLEDLQAQIDAQNSTVIITGGVSRDVQVITSGHIIDQRR